VTIIVDKFKLQSGAPSSIYPRRHHILDEIGWCSTTLGGMLCVDEPMALSVITRGKNPGPSKRKRFIWDIDKGVLHKNADPQFKTSIE
jgi:hypothetical protein